MLNEWWIRKPNYRSRAALCLVNVWHTMSLTQGSWAGMGRGGRRISCHWAGAKIFWEKQLYLYCSSFISPFIMGCCGQESGWCAFAKQQPQGKEIGCLEPKGLFSATKSSVNTGTKFSKPGCKIKASLTTLGTSLLTSGKPNFTQII